MPSREEIATQLSESAGALILCGMDDLAEVLKQRAAQVEAMRCESCYHRCYTSSCSKYNQHILALEDGCFSHEQKPAG